MSKYHQWQCLCQWEVKDYLKRWQYCRNNLLWIKWWHVVNGNVDVKRGRIKRSEPSGQMSYFLKLVVQKLLLLCNWPMDMFVFSRLRNWLKVVYCTCKTVIVCVLFVVVNERGSLSVAIWCFCSSVQPLTSSGVTHGRVTSSVSLITRVLTGAHSPQFLYPLQLCTTFRPPLLASRLQHWT